MGMDHCVRERLSSRALEMTRKCCRKDDHRLAGCGKTVQPVILSLLLGEGPLYLLENSNAGVLRCAQDDRLNGFSAAC
jgi:hypothetical protein